MANYSDADIANMTDEQINNLDMSTVEFTATETPVEELVEEQPSTTTAEEVPETPDENDTDTEADQKDDASTDEVDPDEEVKKSANKTAGTSADKPADAKPTDTAPKVDAASDLTAFHAAITKPFKANGRDMQVASADEAVQLMQMGANYNKKMAGLKPNLALLKMLEKADLLDADKINFLIDVASKKPEAISKLIKDAGIDPLDISVDKAGDYTPTNYRVSDTEQALDEAFDTLAGTEGFDRTLKVIGEQWDSKSRALIADNPQALYDITQHMNAGVFDVVAAKVEREKTFGHLKGLSDLEAYRQVGTAMAESGELEHLVKVAPSKSQQAAPAKVVVEPDPKKADDDERRKKRQAASPSRATTPTSKLPADFNPLAMSDEEIEKLDISKFR